MSDGEDIAGEEIWIRAGRRQPGEQPNQLGYSDLSRLIGRPRHQVTGHFCSRCDGIWYGYLLEVECPACGNRHG